MSNARQTEILEGSMGSLGGVVKNSGTTVGTFCAIKALEDSVVTTVGNITDFSSVTILGGDIIVGKFTSVTVTTGKVILYNDR